MEQLHWPLSILSRAVHYKNLTGASAHVGLSQPQLSRLISQLEKEYNLTLLDRSAKRKSGWTTAAFRLAEIYQQSSRKLQSSIHEMLEDQVPKCLNIGTLEGLSPLALHMVNDLFSKTKVETIELDVFDLNELEEKFLIGDLDLIISIRSPGKQKLKHHLEVGYQGMEKVESPNGIEVLSPYEFGVIKKKKSAEIHKVLISNNLLIRKSWIKNYSGSGVIPSKLVKNKAGSLSSVLILGAELLSDKIWDIVSKVNFNSDLNQD